MPLNFPSTRDGWRFDLVGLLAILGEASVSEIVQPLTAWRFVWLPRLVPAPHALILPNRTTTLPINKEARVVGVHSGTITESLPYFADTIHAVELLDPYSVQVMSVNVDESFAGFKTRTFAPLNLLTLASFALTLGLLGWAGWLQDGPAVVAIALVSVAGSATSLASQWSVQAPRYTSHREVPPADLIIMVRNGAFVVVKCSEYTSRVLYSQGSQRCEYRVSRDVYQVLVSTATVLLMFGIVLMANCTWVMQVALGGSYLTLNAAYLLAALSRNTPRRWLWDLSSVRVENISEPMQCHNYTTALWNVMRETKSATWARAARAVPNTRAWDEWVLRAEAAATTGDNPIDPDEVLSEVLSDPAFRGRAPDVPEDSDLTAAAAAQISPEEHIKETFDRGRRDSDDESDQPQRRARRRVTALM